jgi:hypothetical protein
MNNISEYLFESGGYSGFKSEGGFGLRQINLGSFILDPEDNRKLSVGAIWDLVKGTGLLLI